MRLILTFLAFTCVARATPLRVLIDPGHGGRDRGTVKDGIPESDITLSVSQQLLGLLKKDKRFITELTRQDDRSLTLNERSRLAKDRHSDLFLSIHVNSSPESKAKGAEFYFQNQLPPDEESMFLAHKENDLENGEKSSAAQTYPFLEESTYTPELSAIVSDLLDSDRILRSSQLSKSLKTAWHGTRKGKSNSVRQAPFHVLSQMTVPSALVELGFLTNREDFAELTSPASQARMAQDLYRGLVQYQQTLNAAK